MQQRREPTWARRRLQAVARFLLGLLFLALVIHAALQWWRGHNRKR